MEMFERIKSRRKELGLSQAELAAKAGYSDKSSISKLEKGKSTIPLERQIQLAEALDTTIAYLLGQENIDIEKIAARAEQLRQQNSNSKRAILSQEEINRQIAEAEQEHTVCLEKLCFDPTMPDEDYPARIRYVTSFIEKNSDTLKLAMPGTHMAPDDIEESKKIRAAGGTPDSSE